MKNTRLVLTIWLLAALLLLPGGQAGQAQILSPLPGSQPGVTLLADGIQLDWQTPAPQLVSNPQGEVEVQMAGFETNSLPGAARLPQTSILVALPLQASPVLDIQTAASQTIALAGPVAKIPAGAVARNPDNQAEKRGSFPLVLEEIGSMRGVRLARVTFYPASQAGNQLAVVTHLTAMIHFQTTAPRDLILHDELARLVQSQVVNPRQVETALETSRGQTLPDLAPAVQNPTAIIEVNQPGIYQVTYEQLAAANFPVSQVNALKLKLTHAGIETPYEWTAPQDATFSAGEALRFYAQPTFSRWANNDTYFLTESSAAGKTIAVRSAAVLPGMTPGSAWATPVFEDNQIYTPDCLCGSVPIGRDGDRWVWTRLEQPGKPTDWFELITKNVDLSQEATMTLWWIGWTDVSANPDHLVNVSLNDNPIGSLSWDGKTAYQAALTIPAGVLHTGSNIVSFDIPGLPGVAVDGVWLDAIQLRYKLGSAGMPGGTAFTGSGPTAHSYAIQLDAISGLLAYDVSDPQNPVRLSGYSLLGNLLTLGDDTHAVAPVYHVVNAGGILTPGAVRLQRSLLTASESNADEIILVADGYTTALSNLVTLRTKQGLKVVSENLQSIYDQFSFGRQDPDAIRAYLKTTYLNWTLKPRYVLLVGDGTVDPRHYRADSFNTIAPVMLRNVDPFEIETATDNRFVTLDSETDLLPDMIIGRLPANTPEEAAAMVSKITQYESNPLPGLWHGTTTFIADNLDAGGDFAGIAGRNALLLPGPYFAPQKLFYDINVHDPAAMHADVVAAWNRGTSLILYSGHASVVFWAEEQFLHTSQLAELTNGQKLPVVLDMTCFTGSFQSTSLQTLDESLVRKPDGGALAAWGSTSLGISTGHDFLAQGFLESIVSPAHFGQLGQATLAGRLKLAGSDQQNQYLVDSYILFGDPASRVMLNFTPDHVQMVPVIYR